MACMTATAGSLLREMWIAAIAPGAMQSKHLSAVLNRTTTTSMRGRPGGAAGPDGRLLPPTTCAAPRVRQHHGHNHALAANRPHRRTPCCKPRA